MLKHSQDITVHPTFRPHAAFYDLVLPSRREDLHILPQTLQNEEQQCKQTPVAWRLPTVGPKTTIQALKFRNHFLERSIYGDLLTPWTKVEYTAPSIKNEQLYEAIHQTLRQMHAFDLEDAPGRLSVTLVLIYGSNDAYGCCTALGTSSICRN